MPGRPPAKNGCAVMGGSGNKSRHSMIPHQFSMMLLPDLSAVSSDMIFPDYFSILAQFQLFGIAHLLAILVTFLTAFALTRYARKSPDPKILKRVRYTMAVLLVTAVSLDPVLTLVRYGTGSFGWEMVVESALPLYLLRRRILSSRLRPRHRKPAYHRNWISLGSRGNDARINHANPLI